MDTRSPQRRHARTDVEAHEEDPAADMSQDGSSGVRQPLAQQRQPSHALICSTARPLHAMDLRCMSSTSLHRKPLPAIQGSWIAATCPSPCPL